MPAFNMGGTAASNPSLGHAVAMSPFSGPKGSPFDAKVYPAGTYQPIPSQRVADPNNLSTGALSTGIGFGMDCKLPGIGPIVGTPFTDDYQPGITLPGGTAATTAIMLAIGGGKSTITPGTGSDYSKGTSTPAPYVAQPLLAFGNGGSRDAGAGPAFTGFGTKLVTATADVVNGSAIETGWLNRSGVTLKSGLSQFGSSTTASPAVT